MSVNWRNAASGRRTLIPHNSFNEVRTQDTRSKDLSQRESHLIPRVIVGALQYPDHFAQDDAVDQTRDVIRAFLSNKSARFSGLIGIVAYEIADQNIGIDAFYRRAARLRIAASISSNEARFGAGASKP